MTMKSVAVLILLAMAATYSSGKPMADTTQPKQDPFINLIQEIEQSSFFPALTLNRRLLTFEMFTAAETKHLKDLYDRIGYVVILEYVDALPEDYQHRFISYSVDHLKDEKEYYGYSSV